MFYNWGFIRLAYTIGLRHLATDTCSGEAENTLYAPSMKLTLSVFQTSTEGLEDLRTVAVVKVEKARIWVLLSKDGNRENSSTKSSKGIDALLSRKRRQSVRMAFFLD